MTPQAFVFAGSAVTIVGAIVGAIVALKKLGPEVNRIQVESASELSSMAESLAKQYKTDAEEQRKRNETLDDRVSELTRKYGEAIEQIRQLTNRLGELEETASQVAQLRQDIGRIREERNALRDRVGELTTQNRELRGRVAALENGQRST